MTRARSSHNKQPLNLNLCEEYLRTLGRAGADTFQNSNQGAAAEADAIG